MNEVISKALLLEDNELAALLTGLGVKQFTGFSISSKALEFEEVIRGINSLVRRKVLFRSGESLRLCSEYENAVKCIASAERVYLLECINALIYCGEHTVMLRRSGTGDSKAAVSEITASVLSALLFDEGILPLRDEDELFARDLPDEEGAHQMLIGGMGVCFRRAADALPLLITGRYGLCQIIAYMSDDRFKACIYSRKKFEQAIEQLFDEGQ